MKAGFNFSLDAMAHFGDESFKSIACTDTDCRTLTTARNKCTENTVSKTHNKLLTQAN